MKIAVWHNVGRGGARRHLVQHLDGLAARGHEVKVWCLDSADRDFLSFNHGIEEVAEPLNYEAPCGRGFRNRLRTVGGDAPRLAEAVHAACRSCAAAMDGWGYDIGLATNCRFFSAPHVGRHLRAGPSVLYLHEPTRVLFEALPRLPWEALPVGSPPWWRVRGLKERVRDWLRIQDARVRVREELQNARAFDRILVNSKFNREGVLRAYGLDASVCYQGINVDHFDFQEGPRERVVLGVGSFTLHKNIPLAVQAVAALPPPRPRLVWIGNSGSRSAMNQWQKDAKECGVEFDPIFGADDSVLLDWMHRAAALVYVPRLEPFGLVPLEANACGLPVVTVPEGGLRETMRHEVNALVADPEPVALAGALARILADAGFARNLAQSARSEVVERWALSSAVDRLEEKLMAVAAAPV